MNNDDDEELKKKIEFVKQCTTLQSIVKDVTYLQGR